MEPTTRRTRSTLRKPLSDCTNTLNSPAVLPPATPTLSRPSSTADTTRDETSETCSVYSQRQPAEKRKRKGKTVVAPMSCLPPAKTISTRDKINRGRDDSLSKSLTEPCKKKRSNAPHGKAITIHDTMTKDFIEQQRAYFAEIDAFELPEEEVDTVDESD